MHLAWRWFTGLGFNHPIPHHSTLSMNRHGHFQEASLFRQLFEEGVARCTQAGLVRGDHLSVDGSFVETNAAKESRVPRATARDSSSEPHGAPEKDQLAKCGACPGIVA
jgi:transposase